MSPSGTLSPFSAALAAIAASSSRPARRIRPTWNAAEGDAKAIWLTCPAGRTLQWFTALDELQRGGAVGMDGMPGPLALGVLLTEFSDVMRLAARPRPLVRAALALLARIGRLRGHRVATA